MSGRMFCCCFYKDYYSNSQAISGSDYTMRERGGKEIIVPKTCLFHLTENFLADAFAFLWYERIISYHANK